jgi:hypothetical protein
MCWLLVAVVVVALVGAGQPHQSLLLHPVGVVAEAGEELSYGFLLLHLALLKQSLSALVVQEALLDLPMIQADFSAMMEAIPCLGLGRLLEVVALVVVAQQQLELLEQAVGAWEKLFQHQPRTAHLAVVEAQQLEAVVTVEATGPGAVLGLVGLQQVQPLQLPGGMVEKAALFWHPQHQALLAAAGLALLKLTAATALTQPLILLVAMAVVVEAPA